MTEFNEHHIGLMDEIPSKQQYCGIPPAPFEVVKIHIKQLLETKVINQSCNSDWGKEEARCKNTKRCLHAS